MMNGMWKLAAVAALFLGGVQDRNVRRLQGSVDRLEYGVTVEVDRPFYAQGDVVEARSALFNFSREDAHGWSNARGGNGCEYRFTVVDERGRTVWEPQTICLLVLVAKPLTSGTTLQAADRIPLVFQNDAGIGRQGDPLPPGFYWVCVEVFFNGPHRDPSFAPGLNPMACVPIQIEARG